VYTKSCTIGFVTKPQTTLPTTKRAALEAWCKPVTLTAFERVRFGRVGAANDNATKQVRRAG
jgi:hypothetical protein